MRFYTHFSKPDAQYIRIFCRQELIPLIALVGSKIFYRALQQRARAKASVKPSYSFEFTKSLFQTLNQYQFLPNVLVARQQGPAFIGCIQGPAILLPACWYLKSLNQDTFVQKSWKLFSDAGQQQLLPHFVRIGFSAFEPPGPAILVFRVFPQRPDLVAH